MSAINSNKIEVNSEYFTRSDYNGVSIIVRDKDGYVNATKIAKDNNKQKNFDKYINSDKWKEICDNYTKFGLPKKIGRPDNCVLFYVIKDGTQEIYGTYVHPDLIHFVAEWANIEYAFKVNIIMNEINKLKELKNKDGKENLQDVINELKDKNKYLRKKLHNTDKENKSLHELVEQLHEDNMKLLNENKKQTKMLKKQDNKIDNLTNILKGNEGRLTGIEVKGSKVLMMYVDTEYEGFDKNIKESYKIPIRICCIQPEYMKKPIKEIFDNKRYIFISYLPEAINQNKSILDYIVISKDIGQYLTLFNKGGITKIEIDMIDYFMDYYGENYLYKSDKKLRRKCNDVINLFVSTYLKELRRATENHIIKEDSNDED